MNLKALAVASGITGVVIAIFAGSAIARRAGFGAESWLMTAFALGILLLCLSPVLRLQQQVRDIERRLAVGGEA
jgi:hypothetical protein